MQAGSPHTPHDFPLAPRPFVRRFQFRADIHYRDRVAQDLEVIIDCDDLGRDDPKGFILGNNTTEHALEALTGNRSFPSGALLRSRAPGIEAVVDLHFMQTRGYDSGPTGIIGQFTCSEVTVTESFEDREPGSLRSVRLFVSGPTHFWPCHYFSREVSWTGDTHVTVHHEHVDTGLSDDIRLLAKPCFLYAQCPEGHEAVGRTVALLVQTELSREVLPDERFLSDAISLVDDCSLLLSFLCGTWITWYQYEWSPDVRTVEHFRTARRGIGVDMQDTPVPRHESDAFLKIALPTLRLLQSKDMNPRLPILYAISAREAPSIEDAFVRFFFALEALKDLHAAAAGMKAILRAGEFARVAKRVREVINASQLDSLKAEAMTNKVAELNRPSFAQVLEDMLTSYKLEWRDLYPPGDAPDSPGFLAIRNQLVHTGHISDRREFELETIRLQGIVERVLLRMLGWQDVFSAPRGWTHTLLTATPKPQTP